MENQKIQFNIDELLFVVLRQFRMIKAKKETVLLS